MKSPRWIRRNFGNTILALVAVFSSNMVAQVSGSAPPPNRNMTAPGQQRPRPPAGPQMATIEGYVYWDSTAVQYNHSAPCQGLSGVVSRGIPPSGGTPTFEQFQPLGSATVTFTAMPNVGSFAVCAYSASNVPISQDLQVQIGVQPTAFSPAVSPTTPPTANDPNHPINISGGSCNKLPPSAPSTSVLGSGWWTCGNYAYNVNFLLLITRPAQLIGGSASGTGLLSSGAAAPGGSGTLLSPSNPTGQTQPGVATPGQLLPATQNPSQPQPTSPAIPAPPSVTTVPGTRPSVPTNSNPGSGGGITSQIPQSPGLPTINQTRRANMLKGFVDLHTHPLSNLAFGGKLVYGGVDVGSLLPADPNCNHNVNASTMQQALGHDNSTHGGWGTDNSCGDDIRVNVIHQLQQANKAADPPDDAFGAPDFKNWPVWNDITHQKMWVDWIYRSYQAGLRVMVALAVNNKTLGDATAGPGDYPTDDKSSADLQIREMKNLVQRHANFMEIAYSSADVQRIVSGNKLAIVLGVEIDNIGNLYAMRPLTTSAVSGEISRLYSEGVRYIFPIHIIDNPFGGTAVYEGAFDISNYQMNGKFWDLGCSNPADKIGYIFKSTPLDIPMGLVEVTKLHFKFAVSPPNGPICSTGHENVHGLTSLGEFAIKEMMRRGMLIDIDHMSQKAANRALDLAEGVSGGYPVFSGHNTPRGLGGVSENQRTPQQYARISALGGMAGVGTACRNAYQWLQLYQIVVQEMHQQSAALGTDFNGLVKGMPPRYGTSHEDCDNPRDQTVSSHISYSPFFPKSQLGNKSWDYNTDGVAHYGMLAEFLMDAKTGQNGPQLIDNNLMYGADAFFHAWEKCENQKSKVQ